MMKPEALMLTIEPLIYEEGPPFFDSVPCCISSVDSIEREKKENNNK